MSLVGVAERGYLPDPLIRLGIRRLLQQRLREIAQPSCETEQVARAAFVDALRRSPVALHTQVAIYWQAFRLWLKGAPFFPHPRLRTGGLKEVHRS